MTTVRLFGRNWPCSGGGYFRLLPSALYRAGLSRVNRHDGSRASSISIPGRSIPDQPRIANAGWKSRLRHYTNLVADGGGDSTGCCAISPGTGWTASTPPVLAETGAA